MNADVELYLRSRAVCVTLKRGEGQGKRLRTLELQHVKSGVVVGEVNHALRIDEAVGGLDDLRPVGTRVDRVRRRSSPSHRIKRLCESRVVPFAPDRSPDELWCLPWRQPKKLVLAKINKIPITAGMPQWVIHAATSEITLPLSSRRRVLQS